MASEQDEAHRSAETLRRQMQRTHCLGASIISRTVRIVLLTQIDFVAPPEPEIMIGLCVGVELDLRTACGLKRPRASPGYSLSEKPTEGPRKASKVFSHPMHLWC